MKLLFRKQKRTIGSYTNKKVLWSRDSPCFFPAFLFFDETFFLKITRTATRIPCSQLFHCAIRFLAWVVLRVWNVCVHNLWNVTQESYSVRVQVFGSHCAQGTLCTYLKLLGWFYSALTQWARCRGCYSANFLFLNVGWTYVWWCVTRCDWWLLLLLVKVI